YPPDPKVARLCGAAEIGHGSASELEFNAIDRCVCTGALQFHLIAARGRRACRYIVHVDLCSLLLLLLTISLSERSSSTLSRSPWTAGSWQNRFATILPNRKSTR